MKRTHDLSRAAGVRYEEIDPAKVDFLALARGTLPYLDVPGFAPIASSIGQSAFLMDAGDFILAHVLEALGTKNRVADTLALMRGDHAEHYASMAKATAGTVLNDLATTGAQALSLLMLCAVGDSNWFGRQTRRAGLGQGWSESCKVVRCVWGGGESPALRDLILPDGVVLAGSAMGVIRDKKNLITPDDLRPGLAMVGFASNGVHENGYTSFRTEVAPLVGYDQSLRPYGGKGTFGEALLRPSHLYWPIIRACQEAGIKIYWAINGTGHGLCKWMRTKKKFRFVIDFVPEPQPEFRLIADVTGKTPRQMYAAFNMNIGFAIAIDPKDYRRVRSIARRLGIDAFKLGDVEKAPRGKRSVEVPSLGIKYTEKDFKVH